MIIKDDEVLLRAKKTDPAHIKKLQEERAKVSKRLMKQYESALRRLAQD